MSLLQTVITAVGNKCTELGLKVSWSKTKHLHFTPNTAGKVVIMQNKNIESTRQYKNLGVFQDDKLKFKQQMKHIGAKVDKRIRVMRFLAYTGLGLNTQLLTTFYKVAIRSILEYGSMTFMHSPSALLFLQRKQNQALRIIAKCPTTMSSDILHFDLNITPIKILTYIHNLPLSKKSGYFLAI